MSTKETTKKAAPKGAKTSNAPKAAKAKKAKPAGNGKPKKLSALAAAAKVLSASKEPMNAKQMIEAMAAKGLWSSPGGKTPWATLYSAIARSINKDGKESCFKKAERGKFALNG